MTGMATLSPDEVPVAAASHVTTLTVGKKEVTLVGTAHISARSAEEVAEVIAQVKPDAVCVELCEARHHSLMNPEAWREMDLVQVIRKKQATALLAHLVLAAFQRKLGDRLGVKPGAEMVQALESAGQVGAEVVLADRNIRTTLLRTWRTLHWWDKLKVIGQLPLTLLMSPTLDEQDIEALKSQDMLSQVMEAFSKSFPRAKVTLIDERDQFLSEKIRSAPGEKIVAVVGAGHVKGILEHLHGPRRPVDMEGLMTVPRGGRVLFWAQWLVPVIVLGLIGYGFFSANAAVSWEMVKIWVLANGILAAAGAALALAHPVTILVAFLAAPLTSLNPLVAAGWVAGFCEAVLHKPRVRDFENLASDITSLRGFWRNGITRILLVVALANLGSSAGTLVGIPMMSSLLD